MTARPTWFWTSLFTSIGVNATLLCSVACWLGSARVPETSTVALPDDAGPIYVAVHSVPPTDSILGDTAGKGDAADASPGEQAMQAKAGDLVQAFLSRDPEGPGRAHDDPALSTQFPGENGNGEDGAPSKFGVASDSQTEPTPRFSQPVPPQSIVAGNTLPEKPQPLNRPEQPPQPNSAALDAQTAMASVSETLPLPVSKTPQAQSTGGKPGPSVAPADPAPQGETDSDAFSKKGAVQFKRGSTDVRFGRKHKIVEPRLGLGAQADLLQIPQPISLTLALSLDEKGNVVAVDVLKSSGSRNVNQACKVAAYQWWLEPSKDNSGKPVKDVVPFSIGFP